MAQCCHLRNGDDAEDNYLLMEQYSRTLFNSKFMRDLLEPFWELHDALVKVDNKGSSNNPAPQLQFPWEMHKERKCLQKLESPKEDSTDR